MKTTLVLKIIGIIIMGLTMVHYFGLYNFPNPNTLDKDYEVVISFCIGLLLFAAPTFIVDTAKALLSKVSK